MTTHTFSTDTDPSLFLETDDNGTPARLATGSTVLVRSAVDGTPLPATKALDLGYLSFTTTDVPGVQVSGDDGQTWKGPFWSKEARASTITGNLMGSQLLDKDTGQLLPPLIPASAVEDIATSAATTEVENRNSLAGSFTTMAPQYVADLLIDPGAAMQSFVKDPVSGCYFVAQAGGGDLNLYRTSPSGRFIDKATLTGGGHGASIAIENDGSDVWVWVWWDGEVVGSSNCVRRWKYSGAAEGVTVAEAESQQMKDFDTAVANRNWVGFAIDQATDRIATITRVGNNETIVLRKLSEYKAGTDNALATVGPYDRSFNPLMQGIATTDTHVYVARGAVTDTVNNPPMICQYAWADGTRTDLDVSDAARLDDGTWLGNHNESEGVCLWRQNGRTSLLFGIVTGDAGSRRDSVYALNPPGAGDDLTSGTLRRLVDPLPWTDVTILSGFAARGAGYEPQVARDANGMVYFTGQMANTGLDNMTGLSVQIMQLPDPRFYPAQEQRWIGFSSLYPSITFGGWVNTSGKVYFRNDSNLTDGENVPDAHWCIIISPWRAAS